MGKKSRNFFLNIATIWFLTRPPTECTWEQRIGNTKEGETSLELEDKEYSIDLLGETSPDSMEQEFEQSLNETI